MRGLMVLTATMPVEFDADGGVPMMVGMLVLKEPEKPTTTQ